MFTFMFLILLLTIPNFVGSINNPRCYWRRKQNEDKNGVLVTGCVFTLAVVWWPAEKEYFNNILDTQTPTENKFSLALAFSVDEVNRNSDLLPNMSLVFLVTEGACMTVSQFYSVIPFSENNHDAPPNYICNVETMCAVTLSGPHWEISAMVGRVLYPYKFQQVIQLTYGAFHPILSDREQFPHLYQMASQNTALPLAMVSLMLHFNWKWIGLAISDDNQGTQFLSHLQREMDNNLICFSFINMIPVKMHLFMTRAGLYYNQILTSSTKVIIIYGDTDSILAVSFKMWESLGIQRIWVTTTQWDVMTSKKDFTLDSPHGTIAFAHHHAEVSGFKFYAQTLNPLKYSDEHLASVEWMNFDCEVSSSKFKTLKNCSSNDSLQWVMLQTFDMAFSDESYDIYNAVYTVAYAFHEMLLQQVFNQPMDNRKEPSDNCLKLHTFFGNTHFTNPVGERVDMTQKEKLQEEYDIFQIWNFPYGLGFKVKIGEFSSYLPHGQQLNLYDDMIGWATGNIKMPPSVCSADCGPGFRKYWQEGMSACCFYCSPCPQNEVSNETNMDNCVRCPDDQYANIEQNQCIHKALIFLNYKDPLGMALVLMALCFTVFTALVLVVFWKYHDTPIVKANNRNLSYILLISLIFCFLCSLLFIGRPNSTTCVLQQITFRVVFTVAISTVLAKTVTVFLAFTVTAPGKRMRYILASGAHNYIIAICILIQIILFTFWLGVSPPSLYTDVYAEPGHIIILCNKGSTTAFYCVLGYHGFLALGTFIIAFLARDLPDRYNETKLLTFSMLWFCSVWITFLPVYHSSKGNDMVAIEVFSILASSAGLLACIFIPKCYIILFRPEKNSLQKLREKTSF